MANIGNFTPVGPVQGIQALWNWATQPAAQPQQQQPQQQSSYNAFTSPTAYTSIGDATGYNFVNQATTPEQKTAQQNLNNKIGVTNPAQSTPGGSTSKPPQPQGGGSGGGGTDYNALWRSLGNSGDRPVGWFGPGEQNNAIDAEINNAYNSLLGRLDQVAGFLRGSSDNDIARIDRESQAALDKSKGNQQIAVDELNEKLRRFGESVRGSENEQRRSYQALNQNRMSRYGLGSSVGYALGEIGNQEFLRNLNNLYQERTTGEKDFAMEGSRMKRFYEDQENEISMNRQRAKDEVVSSLNQKLAEIEMKKGEAEVDKSNKRIAALQDAISQARNIEAQAENDKKQLFSWFLEVSANQPGFNIATDLPQTVQQFQNLNLANILGTGSVPNASVAAQIPRLKYDEYGNLLS